MVNRPNSFDQIPYGELVVDETRNATPWFQALWQRMANASGRKGTGSYAAVSGAVAIPHGLGVIPDIGACSVQFIGTTSVVVTLVSVDVTNLNAKLFTSSTGVAVSDASYSLAWRAAKP